jgi:hypothetical protein
VVLMKRSGQYLKGGLKGKGVTESGVSSPRPPEAEDRLPLSLGKKKSTREPFVN